MPEVARRNDPYRSYNFRVEIDRVGSAGFRECSGLSFTTDPVEYREGNEKNLHVRKLTGLRKFGNIVLKRGFTRDKTLYSWYKDILNGKVERHIGSITLIDEEQNDVLRWNFEGGWICKWEGPSFNATSNDVAIENLELCIERVELA